MFWRGRFSGWYQPSWSLPQSIYVMHAATRQPVVFDPPWSAPHGYCMVHWRLNDRLCTCIEPSLFLQLRTILTMSNNVQSFAASSTSGIGAGSAGKGVDRGIRTCDRRICAVNSVLMFTGMGGAGRRPEEGVDGVGGAGVRLLPGAHAAVLCRGPRRLHRLELQICRHRVWPPPGVSSLHFPCLMITSGARPAAALVSERLYLQGRECIFVSVSDCDLIDGCMVNWAQARDLLQHLWTGPISNAPVDIVQGSNSVEVRPVGISKVCSCPTVLSSHLHVFMGLQGQTVEYLS